MLTQLSLDFTATALKERGMKRAIDNAGAAWNEKADQYFQVYLNHDCRGEFTCEMFRVFLKDNFPHFEDPPSNRAYAGVITRAKNANLIKCVGTVQTKLPSAHKCFASLWKKI